MRISRIPATQTNLPLSTKSSTFSGELKPRQIANYFIPKQGSGLNNSNRATGAHLGPGHPDLLVGAHLLADSLLCAQGRHSTYCNTLISPASLNDSALRTYGERLMAAAVANPDEVPIGMQSPAIVPYLLGGIPLLGVETLVDRILEVMEFFPEVEKGTFAASTKPLGFSAWQTHAHLDELAVERDPKVSARQNYLINHIRFGNWVDTLLTQGAYNATLRKRMAALKPDACSRVQALLDPRAGHMTELAAMGREPVEIFDRDFAIAVQRVYERPWAELDLKGGTTRAEVTDDIQVLLARQLIQAQATKVKMSAQTLVGISLLTGVSIAKYTEFAVYDCQRRGETFITADTIDQAVDMLNMSAAGAAMGCERALSEHALALRYADPVANAMAQRLKSPKKPLWSLSGSFYRLPGNQYKHKLENFHK